MFVERKKTKQNVKVLSRILIDKLEPLNDTELQTPYMFHASDLCLALDYVRVKDFHIIVAACNAETYHLLCFLWVTLARKSTKFGSRYLGQRSSEWDEILQVARGGWCTHHPNH